VRRAEASVTPPLPAGEDGKRWLKRPRPDGDPGTRLFCFHHAGGTASMYRRWPAMMPQAIEPIAVQLPGRAERFREPPFEEMAPLVDALVPVIRPYLGRPFAFYGLSMGGRVAWALAHRLRAESMPLPSVLFLASVAAPGWEEGKAAIWAARKENLVGYLREMGGTPPELFAQPELLASLLPTLRADLTLVDSLRFTPGQQLDVPIRAFAGASDVEGAPERMSGWRDQTRGGFELQIVSGGHFFDANGELAVIRSVSEHLMRELSARPVPGLR
jgi:medium-chain acyl-[acyl-carrier-protein] hydrolase